jgi:beta-mannosidase
MSNPSDSDIYALERRAHHPCLSLIDLAEESKHKIEDIKAAAPDLAVAVWEKFPEYTSCPSLPSDRTVAAIVPEDERNLFSHSIEKLSSDESIKKMLMSVAERYPYPGNLSDFSYASALASASRVKENVFRARLSGNKQRAIFGTLSDERAIVSPSAIDCACRWKPLQYHSMRNFSPLAIYAEAEGCRVTFSVSNARKNDLIGSLEYRIVDASNLTIFKSSEPCEVSAFSTQVVLTKDFSEHLEGHLRDYYLEYSIKEGVTYPCSNTLLFVPEKHFKFKKPDIKAEVVGADRRFNITLSANCFVKDLELNFEGVDAIFSENYIDLTSSAPVKIAVTLTGALETAYHLGRILKLRSVYNIK